jgi:hypothetical protein
MSMAGEAVQDRLRLARGQSAGFRRAGARGIGRIEAVDIEGDIGGPVTDDCARPLDDPCDAEAVDIFDVQHGHP